MLTEAIRSCTEAIELQRQVRERRAAQSQFSVNLMRLSALISGIRKTLSCADEMRDCQIVKGPVFTEAVRDELLTHADECGKAVYEQSLNADKVKLLEVHVKAAEQQLEEVWKQAAPVLAEPLQGRLSILRDLSNDRQRVRELESRLQNDLTAQVTRERVRAFAKDLAEATKIVNAFPLAPGIEAFLQKVSESRATLTDLTPEVLEWVLKNQFQRKFRVVSSP